MGVGCEAREFDLGKTAEQCQQPPLGTTTPVVAHAPCAASPSLHPRRLASLAGVMEE